MEINQITQTVIGAAIEVHKALGPGLLESAYEACLCREMALRGVPFERQKPWIHRRDAENAEKMKWKSIRLRRR